MGVEVVVPSGGVPVGVDTNVGVLVTGVGDGVTVRVAVVAGVLVTVGETVTVAVRV